jgi:hypothetical protein
MMPSNGPQVNYFPPFQTLSAIRQNSYAPLGKQTAGRREPVNKFKILSVERQSYCRCRDLPPGLGEVVPRYPTLIATLQPSDLLI